MLLHGLWGVSTKKTPMVQLFQVGLSILFPICFPEYVLHFQSYKHDTWLIISTGNFQLGELRKLDLTLEKRREKHGKERRKI